MILAITAKVSNPTKAGTSTFLIASSASVKIETLKLLLQEINPKMVIRRIPSNTTTRGQTRLFLFPFTSSGINSFLSLATFLPSFFPNFNTLAINKTKPMIKRRTLIRKCCSN